MWDFGAPVWREGDGRLTVAVLLSFAGPYLGHVDYAARLDGYICPRIYTKSGQNEPRRPGSSSKGGNCPSWPGTAVYCMSCDKLTLFGPLAALRHHPGRSVWANVTRPGGHGSPNRHGSRGCRNRPRGRSQADRESPGRADAPAGARTRGLRERDAYSGAATHGPSARGAGASARVKPDAAAPVGRLGSQRLFGRPLRRVRSRSRPRVWRGTPEAG